MPRGEEDGEGDEEVGQGRRGGAEAVGGDEDDVGGEVRDSTSKGERVWDSPRVYMFQGDTGEGEATDEDGGLGRHSVHYVLLAVRDCCIGTYFDNFKL